MLVDHIDKILSRTNRLILENAAIRISEISGDCAPRSDKGRF
jgi:hypothetical protein